MMLYFLVDQNPPTILENPTHGAVMELTASFKDFYPQHRLMIG